MASLNFQKKYNPGQAPLYQTESAWSRIKDWLKIIILSTPSVTKLCDIENHSPFYSLAPNCYRSMWHASHMSQNDINLGAKLLTSELFMFDPGSIDQADLVSNEVMILFSTQPFHAQVTVTYILHYIIKYKDLNFKLKFIEW